MVALHLLPVALHSCSVESLHCRYAQLQFRGVPCCRGKCSQASNYWGWWGRILGGIWKRNSFSNKTQQCRGLPSMVTWAVVLPLWWVTRKAFIFPSAKWSWGEWNDAKVLFISKIHQQRPNSIHCLKLKYNSYTTKFTLLKCTIRCF